MMHKGPALLLAAVLLMGCLTGCAATGAEPTATPEPTAVPEETTAPRDYTAARAKYPADAVVMTVDGSEVTWDEYFYWLYYTLSYAEQYVGTISDFSEPCAFDETQTYGEYFRAGALEMVVQYHALEANAQAAGAVLTAEDEAYLEELLASDIASTVGEEGTEEDFYAYLETVNVSPELYAYINSVSCLYAGCFDLLYGESGEKLPAEEVDAFAEANGYLTVKHILLSTVDTEGEALGDEAKAEKRTVAEDLAAQLGAETDPDARLALFDTLMNEYSEDTGLPYYPDGYCFSSGEMDEAF